jgi:hypothetical protein
MPRQKAQADGFTALDKLWIDLVVTSQGFGLISSGESLGSSPRYEQLEAIPAAV